jgi:hypothetical protein
MEEGAPDSWRYFPASPRYFSASAPRPRFWYAFTRIAVAFLPRLMSRKQIGLLTEISGFPQGAIISSRTDCRKVRRRCLSNRGRARRNAGEERREP